MKPHREQSQNEHAFLSELTDAVRSENMSSHEMYVKSSDKWGAPHR